MTVFSRSTLTDRKAIIDLANRLSNHPKIGLDTEFSGPDLIHKKKGSDFVNFYRATLTGISIALGGEWPESYYIPISHKKGDSNAPLPAVATLFRALAEYQGIVAIHNAKAELRAMRLGPVPFAGFAQTPHCTQVLCWLLQDGVLDREGHMRYGLKVLAPHHFGIKMREFSEVTGGLSFDQLDPSKPETRDYACEDAEVALLLHDLEYPKLAQFPGLEDTYLNVELPFIHVLRHMEDSGMPLDTDVLEEVVADFEAQAAALKSQWDSEWPEISITSSKQLQWFYENGHWSKLGVPKKAHGFSTEADWIKAQLERLRNKQGSVGYRAAALKAEFSKLNTLVTTFGMSMAEKAWQYPDLRLHGEYVHTGTATGRLSSNYPNLQNIPTRTKDGKRIRDAFIAPDGRLLVSADYSQIELRVLAHFNGAGILYDGYRAGTDVHRQTAAMLFGIPLDQVTDEQRSIGKTGNFSSVYGAGPEKFARKAGLKGGKAEGKEVLERLKAANPESYATLKRAAQAAERRGYVRTLLNRIRRIDIPSHRRRYEELRAAGHTWQNSEEYRQAWLDLGGEERKAGNTPIQGGARDIMTLGMIKFYQQMDKSKCRIVGQIHDDLMSEMDEDYVEEGMALKQECLEKAYQLRVPLIAEPKAAKAWSGLK